MLSYQETIGSPMNKVIITDIDIKGANAKCSFVRFLDDTIKNIPYAPPDKIEKKSETRLSFQPKSIPSTALSFTSPKPKASFTSKEMTKYTDDEVKNPAIRSVKVRS